MTIRYSKNGLGMLNNTDFANLEGADLNWIMDRLNLRPHKCLYYRTPFEVYFKIYVALDT